MLTIRHFHLLAVYEFSFYLKSANLRFEKVKSLRPERKVNGVTAVEMSLDYSVSSCRCFVASSSRCNRLAERREHALR